ncbi:MAG: hypothetical protein DMG07_25195 [Acidobacteria bacterium]|nr:MAG: hypothetical protein DMG07_25195 [Acidobacteriota bacterium]
MTGLLLAIVLALQAPEVEAILARENDPEALSQAARGFAEARRYAEAELLWRRAAELRPDFFPALFNLGFMHFSRERFQDAAPWLERASRARPKDYNARYLLGTALVRLDRREEGLRAWRAALALRPDDVRLMQVMSVEDSKGRYYTEAAAIARRALGVQADDQGGAGRRRRGCGAASRAPRRETIP